MLKADRPSDVPVDADPSTASVGDARNLRHFAQVLTALAILPIGDGHPREHPERGAADRNLPARTYRMNDLAPEVLTVVSVGKREDGEVYFVPQCHSTAGINSHDLALTGEYQLEILKLLHRHRAEHVFEEGLTRNCPTHAERVALFGDEELKFARSLQQPGGRLRTDLDKWELRMLGGYGAAEIYSLQREDVKLYRTATEAEETDFYRRIHELRDAIEQRTKELEPEAYATDPKLSELGRAKNRIVFDERESAVARQVASHRLDRAWVVYGRQHFDRPTAFSNQGVDPRVVRCDLPGAFRRYSENYSSGIIDRLKNLDARTQESAIEKLDFSTVGMFMALKSEAAQITALCRLTAETWDERSEVRNKDYETLRLFAKGPKAEAAVAVLQSCMEFGFAGAKEQLAMIEKMRDDEQLKRGYAARPEAWSYEFRLRAANEEVVRALQKAGMVPRP